MHNPFNCRDFGCERATAHNEFLTEQLIADGSTKFFQFTLHPNSSYDPHAQQLRRRAQSFYLLAYLFVHSTPSFADGALARSLTMPAPTEKSKTFCQPS